MDILVTGGAGYVGSHTVRTLVRAGHRVVVIDNLSSGHPAAVTPPAKLICGDLADAALLDRLFLQFSFDAVMHFAACIEVGESVIDPLRFYDNNLGNTIRLLQVMQRHQVRRFIFSSTCATYGAPGRVPVTEDMPQRPVSPYGRTKLGVEWALADSAAAWELGFAALRYFNAAGAADDASIGEDHNPESHLVPVLLQVALGQREHVKVFGTDYDTPDGTCIRDYVHVEDLADAHLRAVATVEPGDGRFYNLGTGCGASVRTLIEVARAVTGHALPVVEAARRPGDPPALYADANKIQRELGWKPKHASPRDMVASAWAWHRSHPKGFQDQSSGSFLNR
jgi:UDP-glucose 4-epimerase